MATANHNLITAVDHCGTYGEVMADHWEQGRLHHVTIRPGIDATTCGYCEQVITHGRLAAADEVARHDCRAAATQPQLTETSHA